MSEHERRLVIVSGGGVGLDPFDERSWSGSAHRFMKELRGRGLLHSVISVKPAPLSYGVALARTFHRDRGAWHHRLYRDIGYRSGLTAAAARGLANVAPEHPVLQLGGYYDVASVAGDRDCYGYFDGTIGAWAQEEGSITPGNHRWYGRLISYEALACRGMRGVFTMSEHLRQSMIDDYGVLPDRAVVAGAGINEDEVPPVDEDKDYGSQEILFIGRDFERKGGPDLLEAFAMVKRRMPSATLHVVGPVDPLVPDDLRAGVVLHGPVEKSTGTFAHLMRRSSLFVLPSRYEPFGIAPLEAMAWGVPAVVTGRWALKECVDPGVTGAWVRPRDPEGLSEVLSDLLSDPARLGVMGRAARTSVVQRFTWASVVSRMAEHMGLEPVGRT